MSPLLNGEGDEPIIKGEKDEDQSPKIGAGIISL